MAKVGRPTKYSEKIADDICTRLVEGESIRQVCRDPSMPALSSVMLWLRKHPEFSEQYARSRVDQGHTIYGEICEVEEKVASGEMNPNQGRVLIDSKKWRAARMEPRVYGDKVRVETDSVISINVVKFSDAGEPKTITYQHKQIEGSEEIENE